MKPTVLLVLPAHNEEKFLESSVHTVLYELSKLQKDYNFTLVIAEDGSEDRTFEIGRQLSSKFQEILILHHEKKLGRGKSVKVAWSQFNADVYAYMDVDLATNVTQLEQLISSILDGVDLATGSRYKNGALTNRPFLRLIVSQSYNRLIRIIFKTGVFDHQCGFKAVSKSMCDYMLKHSKFDDWFWDTELFILAKRNGYAIYEFPVEWVEKRSSKTPIRRLVKDIGIHGAGIVKSLIRIAYS